MRSSQLHHWCHSTQLSHFDAHIDPHVENSDDSVAHLTHACVPVFFTLGQTAKSHHRHKQFQQATQKSNSAPNVVTVVRAWNGQMQPTTIAELEVLYLQGAILFFIIPLMLSCSQRVKHCNMDEMSVFLYSIELVIKIQILQFETKKKRK